MISKKVFFLPTISTKDDSIDALTLNDSIGMLVPRRQMISMTHQKCLQMIRYQFSFINEMSQILLNRTVPKNHAMYSQSRMNLLTTRFDVTQPLLQTSYKHIHTSHTNTHY